MAVQKHGYDNTLFTNGLDTLVCDFGNNTSKALLNVESALISGVSAVAEITPKQFEAAIRRYAGTPFQWDFIGYKGKFYAIGEVAVNYNPTILVSRPQGRAKLRRDWYGLLMVWALLQLYHGAIPQYMNIYGAYPPADEDLVEDLYKSVGGKWRVKTLTGDIAFEIVTFDASDEIEGSAFWYRYGTQGIRKTPNIELIEGSMYAFDFGGGTADLVALDKNLIPIAGTYKSIRIGVNQIFTQFKAILDFELRELMPFSEDGIPMQVVYEIVIHPQKHLIWAGETIDCSEWFTEASNSILGQLYAALQSQVGSLEMLARNILISGGAGGVLYQDLGEVLFPKYLDGGRLYLADSPLETIYANVRGLRLKLLAKMTRERQRSAFR